MKRKRRIMRGAMSTECLKISRISYRRDATVKTQLSRLIPSARGNQHRPASLSQPAAATRLRSRSWAFRLQGSILFSGKSSHPSSSILIGSHLEWDAQAGMAEALHHKKCPFILMIQDYRNGTERASKFIVVKRRLYSRTYLKKLTVISLYMIYS